LRSSGAGRAYTHPVDVYLGRNDVVQPDLVVVLESHLPQYQPDGVFEGPPDIMVEILSPSTQRTGRVRKMALYASAGVPEYWIADPERRTVIVNLLVGEEYVAAQPEADGWLASRVLTGLRVNPSDVFTGLD
jgi:Uma2 family endonuclease